MHRSREPLLAIPHVADGQGDPHQDKRGVDDTVTTRQEVQTTPKRVGGGPPPMLPLWSARAGGGTRAFRPPPRTVPRPAHRPAHQATAPKNTRATTLVTVLMQTHTGSSNPSL